MRMLRVSVVVTQSRGTTTTHTQQALHTRNRHSNSSRHSSSSNYSAVSMVAAMTAAAVPSGPLKVTALGPYTLSSATSLHPSRHTHSR